MSLSAKVRGPHTSVSFTSRSSTGFPRVTTGDRSPPASSGGGEGADLKEKAHTGGSAVKNPPATQKMWVCSLSQEDPLEWETATHSSILLALFHSQENPWTEEPDGLQSIWTGRTGHDLTKSPSAVSKACPQEPNQLGCYQSQINLKEGKYPTPGTLTIPSHLSGKAEMRL